MEPREKSADFSAARGRTIISDAKLGANRRNAAKSTGPKTKEGIAKACMNALRHGLLSESVLLPEEDEDRLERLREGLLAVLRPEGELEEVLAEQVIAAAWRLRRARRIEVGLLQRAQMDVWPPGSLPPGKERLDLGYAFLTECQGPHCITKLARYETAIDRAFYRARHELQRLQALRAGKPVPTPVAVDVTVDGGFVSQNPLGPTELPNTL